MTTNKKHVIILPYFCQEEVDRYLQIAARLRTFPKPNVACDFLLASSPRTETSQSLVNAYSELGNTIPFACPTQIFGYPEGPGAMFWDCMEFIEQNYQSNDGFSLWLESDMAPIKSNWLDRLSDEWYSESQTPVMMGSYVPEVYKYRVFKKPKLILHPHINGGACYAMDFAAQMPEAARTGVFDMAVYQFAKKLGRARFTRQIAFSTHDRVRRDMADQDKVLLHGFMQEKDRFIEQCLTPLSATELKRASWNPLLNRIETAKRKLRVQFVRRGHRAMLENMFLAKQKFESENPQVFANPTRRVA
jgi:archaeosine-15-forming tRNA-guanine transglycosylase